jgi:hypothetical protein
MKDDKKIERAAIIAAAVFGAATLAVLVMQITPRTGVLPAAGYGEGGPQPGPTPRPM